MYQLETFCNNIEVIKTHSLRNFLFKYQLFHIVTLTTHFFSQVGNSSTHHAHIPHNSQTRQPNTGTVNRVTSYLFILCKCVSFNCNIHCYICFWVLINALFPSLFYIFNYSVQLEWRSLGQWNQQYEVCNERLQSCGNTRWN